MSTQPKEPPKESTCMVCGEKVVYLIATNYSLWKHADGVTRDHRAEPESLSWHTVHANLVSLVNHLAYVEDWTGREIADVVEKPWKFHDEWAAYQSTLKAQS